jgi:hypothetical protein
VLDPAALVAVLEPCPWQEASKTAAAPTRIAVPDLMANTYRSSSMDTPGGTALAR